MKGRKMLSNSEVAVFCEQSGMILESGLSMLEGISIMEEDVELHKQLGCWLRSSHSFKECVIAH